MQAALELSSVARRCFGLLLGRRFAHQLGCLLNGLNLTRRGNLNLLLDLHAVGWLSPDALTVYSQRPLGAQGNIYPALEKVR